MAANEKQLEKVTLTLTNKMVGSQAASLAAERNVPFCRSLTYNTVKADTYVTRTCPANLTQLQAAQNPLFPWQPMSITTSGEEKWSERGDVIGEKLFDQGIHVQLPLRTPSSPSSPHTLTLSPPPSVTVKQSIHSLYQVRALMTWQIRLVGSISSKMNRRCVCVCQTMGLECVVVVSKDIS